MLHPLLCRIYVMLHVRASYNGYVPSYYSSMYKLIVPGSLCIDYVF